LRLGNVVEKRGLLLDLSLSIPLKKKTRDFVEPGAIKTF
jgi:hypothetical protein